MWHGALARMVATALLNGLPLVMRVVSVDDPVPPVLRLSPGGGEAIMQALDTRTGHLFVLSNRHVAMKNAPMGDAVVGVVSTVDVARGVLAHEVIVPPFLKGEYMALDERHGRVLVVSTPDTGNSSLSVLDAQTGGLLRRITLGPNPVALAVAHTSGRAFIIDDDSDSGGRGHIWVCDTRTGALLRSLPINANPVEAAIDETSGRVFVVAGTEGQPYSVSTLDTRTGTLLHIAALVPHTRGRLPDADAGPITVDERQGRVFVLEGLSYGKSGVAIFDATTGMLLRTVPLGPNPNAIIVDTQSGRAFVELGTPGHRASVSTLDTRSGALLRTVTVGVDSYTSIMAADIGATAIDEKRGRIFVGATGRVTVLDVRSGRVLRVLRTHDTSGAASTMVVDDTTGHLFVYGTRGTQPGGASASVFDVATGRGVSTLILPNLPPVVATVNAERAQVVVLRGGPVPHQADEPGYATILDVRNGTVLRDVHVGSSPLAALVDPRSGRTLVLDQDDDTVTEIGPMVQARAPKAPTQSPPTSSPTVSASSSPTVSASSNAMSTASAIVRIVASPARLV